MGRYSNNRYKYRRKHCKTFSFLNTEKKSFSKYKGEDKNLFRLAAILQYFDTGVCLTKIKNEKDAGGDIETHYTSYGVYKKANAKYIITKICQE